MPPGRNRPITMSPASSVIFRLVPQKKCAAKCWALSNCSNTSPETAAPRLSAEIPDESCLRCHDTRLLSGRVEFHGVPFDHRPHLTETRRGKNLRCTSCHSQIVQGPHMTVTTSTCFLCHFKDGMLNEGLGTCTRCHQIPEKKFDLGGGVKFSHELAYERGVDCANCHSDIIRGNGEVPKERCSVCHNRQDDLRRIDDHVFLHQKHVTEHKIDCLDCHLEIQHSLDPHKLEHAASNCQACHANEHSEQVRMLHGEGGKSLPGAMVVWPRLGFRAPPVIKSKKHRPRVPFFGKHRWPFVSNVTTKRRRTGFKNATSNSRACSPRLKPSRRALVTAVGAANLDETQTAQFTKRLRDLEDDLQFLRVGNSIHNMHYADSLLHALVDNLRAICLELKIPEPAIEMPQKLD